jgi:hypothetical protein
MSENEDSEKDPVKVAAGEKGGRARAAALSPEERREIATAAAAARWGPPEPGAVKRATHTGDLEIGGNVIPCAVLEDGTRVLTEHGMTNALLGSRSGASKRLKRAALERGLHVPLFLAPRNLQPFISDELLAGPLKPIVFHQGRRYVIGFSAEALPAVCDVWLRARAAGVLQDQQQDKASKAEILMRGLAHVGITALVDEATGYQELRDRRALQAILDRYLRAEYAKWAKRFPDEFYREMFRLRGWQWEGMQVNRPSVVGKYTNDFVYARLAPGVLDELQRLNPKDETGRRRAKHHQWLTDDIGHPALESHLNGVLALMRASTSWEQFTKMLQRAYPKINTTFDIPFRDNE